MRKALLKLIFATSVMLVLVPFKGSILRASSDNWCSCDGEIWLYQVHPQYGPFTYLYYWEYPVDGSLNDPGPYGWAVCADTCQDIGEYIARTWACDQFSDSEYPNQHYQIFGYFYFDDFDDTSGGSAHGQFNSGATTILYCP